MNLFEGFPREIGSPRTSVMRDVIFNIDQLISFANVHNGYNDVFVSAYAFRKVNQNSDGRYTVDYQSAIVDKIFIDLDGTKKSGDEKNPLRAWEDAQKIHEWAKNGGFLHTPLCSGQCYQLYIFIEQNLKNPSVAMKNFLIYLGRELNVLIDPKIRGNLAQLVRYPDTWNPKGRRFCISVEDFGSLNHIDILRRAKQQSKQIFIYGDTLLDLTRWDREMEIITERVQPIAWTPEFEGKLDRIAEGVKKLNLAPCIKRLMTHSSLGYEGRWLVIATLCELGIPPMVIYKVLKSFLNPQKFRHCVDQEAYAHGGMINYIYSKVETTEGGYMWSCSRMRENGYCVEGCVRIHPVYK